LVDQQFWLQGDTFMDKGFGLGVCKPYYSEIFIETIIVVKGNAKHSKVEMKKFNG